MTPTRLQIWTYMWFNFRWKSSRRSVISLVSLTSRAATRFFNRSISYATVRSSNGFLHPGYLAPTFQVRTVRSFDTLDLSETAVRAALLSLFPPVPRSAYIVIDADPDLVISWMIVEDFTDIQLSATQSVCYVVRQCVEPDPFFPEVSSEGWTRLP